MLVYLFIPIAVVVLFSFNSVKSLQSFQGFSLQWYREMWNAPEWARAARNSFIVAPVSTLLATVLGTLAAMGLARNQFMGKSLLTGLLYPLAVTGVAGPTGGSSSLNVTLRVDASEGGDGGAGVGSRAGVGWS